MALTWNTVKPWIERNPFQTAALKPYSPALESVGGKTELTDSNGWTRIPVVPATPLSAVLLVQDTTYTSSPVNARKALLRDELTDLQEKAPLLLKGRQWPVRKTAEGLAAVGLEEGRASTWPVHGWRALCALRECQIITLNEQTKEISFYPEDIRTWSSEVETMFVEYEARYVWICPQEVNLLTWLSEKEAAGWSIPWPEADGSMEDLKKAAIQYSVSLPTKIKKEALAKRIGHAEAIQNLSKWNTKSFE